MGNIQSFNPKPFPLPQGADRVDAFFDDDFDADPDPFNDDIVAQTCDTENPESCESCT